MHFTLNTMTIFECNFVCTHSRVKYSFKKNVNQSGWKTKGNTYGRRTTSCCLPNKCSHYLNVWVKNQFFLISTIPKTVWKCQNFASIWAMWGEFYSNFWDRSQYFHEPNWIERKRNENRLDEKHSFDIWNVSVWWTWQLCDWNVTKSNC